jgi:ubiquinone/menaquinone biosynthesis C-methylase UbiE
MTMRHRGEGTALWHRAFRYRWLERQIATRPDVTRLLDLGCGSGENMWRFVEWGRTPLGMDLARDRLDRARAYGPVTQGEATSLPFADEVFDMVYLAHVLHHVADAGALLREVRRCLRPAGTLFVVETIENHPLIRLGRDLYPWWHGDAIETRLRFGELVEVVRTAGFEVQESGQYSVFFWIWEVFTERIRALDALTPFFTALEVALGRVARRWSAHAYCVAVRE